MPKPSKTFLPADWQPNAATFAKLTAEGYDLDAHLEYFTDYCLANGIQYCDFNAAFRNCCRGDWGGIRRAKPKAQWWSSDEGILAHAKELGISARPGESMRDFKARLERC